MTIQRNTSTSTKEAIKTVQSRIAELQRSKQNIPVISGYEVKRNKELVKASKTLLPLIRAFKRDGSRFIFPNGSRVRFGKIKFIFKKKIENVNASWGDYLFDANQDWNHKIYYSFKHVYAKNTNYSIPKIKSINEEEYQFSLFELEQLETISVDEILKQYSNEEIEQFAIYGIRSPQDKYDYKEKLKKINDEISDLQILEKNLNQVWIFENKKDSLIEMVNTGNIDKRKLSTYR